MHYWWKVEDNWRLFECWDSLLEENEKLIIDFDLLKVWTILTWEHQVDVDNYGQTRRISFLPFDVVCCLVLDLLSGLIGLLKACVL